MAGGAAGADPALVPGRLWLLTDRRYLAQRMPIALVTWLCERGLPPAVVLADDAGAALWSWLEPGDLVVARSRHALTPALIEEARARGARVLDAPAAVARVRDKHACMRRLARHGMPVPATAVAHCAADLGYLADSAFPLVVKPVLGDNARGVRILRGRGELGEIDWATGPHLVQEYVEAGGIDTKLYVAGEHVWATRRASPLLDAGDAALRVPVTPALEAIAEGCRRAFGLTLFGVDVLDRGDGLAIVDVNEFPNYTGIEEAPQAIGSLLLRTRQEPAELVELSV